MKILTKVKTLEKELIKSIKAINYKSPIPILSHILLRAEKNNELNLYSTDLEIGIENKTQAQVLEEGSACIPAKVFAEIMGYLNSENEIVIESNDNMLEIRDYNKNYKLNILPEEDFPKLPKPSDIPLLTVKKRIFKQLISDTVFSAASIDETQAVLTGVLFLIKGQVLSMISTDGRRLSKIEHRVNDVFPAEEKYIVPSKSLIELHKIIDETEGEVEIFTNQYQIFFKFDNVIFYSRLIEGQYPNFEKVILKDNEVKISFSIKREKILKSIKGISIMACERESPNLIKFDINENKIIINSKTQDLGEAQEEIEIKPLIKGKLNIAFNSRYLIDALNNMEEKEVEFRLKGEKNPGLIKPVGRDEYLYAVMPIELMEKIHH